MSGIGAFLCFAALVLVGGPACAQAITLHVGDTAPPITVAKWVKGIPVTTLGNGKVNVVEFWATWCGPCKECIPHLTELAKKYQGKVTFTGVSISERAPASEYIAKVGKFVQEMGPKMDYNVAVDDKPADGSMATNWMDAAGQYGIPTAFVIGKDQKIAWIGHPMDDSLPSVLDQMLADVRPEEPACRSPQTTRAQEDGPGGEGGQDPPVGGERPDRGCPDGLRRVGQRESGFRQ
jgi:thiol-disulfide isomerase/thioredoxin